jgi:non-specific serine/threonine protein kinase
MNTLDDWPRLKQVLEGALARKGDDRQAYLAGACGADAALRVRIDNLLAVEDRARTFLETPAAVLLEPAVREDLSGRLIGSYQLMSRLGAGGMGEVYLAHDMKLDRPVALKVLSPAFAADRDRLRRFHQEARAASSLNHPHIVVVHDFGELDGRPYIVTEFIEGETLRNRLRKGRLPIRDVIDVGLQIAGALAAAHARGLVHRDIKPDNVMVRPDGYAKVLDFGIAKLATVTPSSDRVDAESLTQPGMVIGTPHYMSPEQARGLDLDARSDVWSLGAVLYEMATGGLPATASDHATRDLPPELLRIICKALETVRDRRYESAAGIVVDLKHLQRETESVRRPALTGPRTLALAAIPAIALGVLVGVMSMRGDRGASTTEVQKTVAVLPFDNVSRDGGIDYLRLALADEVATALSSTPWLAVRPMASSRRFAGSERSPQEAGRQLRAGGVVTGHFSMHDSELQVTVEAVDVDSNRLLWRDTIAVAATDTIALRDRLTSRIREGLLPALGARASTAPDVRPRNAEAYATYLKSLAISNDPGPNREAIAMLERASTIDPDRADTWAALGFRYYYEGQYGAGGSEAFRRSEAALKQALTLDPGHIPAAVRLVVHQVDTGRIRDGYDNARRLVERRPDSGDARFALSVVLRYGGLLEDSARECGEAVLRDPTNPAPRTCSATFIQLGQYDRALDFVRLDSGSEWARLVTRWVYQRMGRRDDAREQLRQQSPGYPPGMVPAGFHGFMARCLSRDAPAGADRFSDVDVRTFLTARDSEPLYFFAGDLAYCDDSAAALRLLRESIPRNYCATSAIETDPAFASIRSRAEYKDILDAARACRNRFREYVGAKTGGHNGVPGRD